MARYSIMVRERGSDQEVELCQCENNPQAIVTAAQQKFLLVHDGLHKRRVTVPKYEHVYFRDRYPVSA